jgi:hypothetical protein
VINMGRSLKDRKDDEDRANRAYERSHGSGVSCSNSGRD